MTILDDPRFFAAVRARCAERGHRWEPGEVAIVGRITDATVLDVAARLRHAGRGPVVVTVDSTGGEVDAAEDITALLDAYRAGARAEVRTSIVRAESAAGVIAQAGHPRVMRTHGMISMHAPYQARPHGRTTVTADMGTLARCMRDERASDDLRSRAALELGSLLDTAQTIVDAYAERTGQPAEVWRTAMIEEARYGAYAAVLAGLADGVEA